MSRRPVARYVLSSNVFLVNESSYAGATEARWSRSYMLQRIAGMIKECSYFISVPKGLTRVVYPSGRTEGCPRLVVTIDLAIISTSSPEYASRRRDTPTVYNGEAKALRWTRSGYQAVDTCLLASKIVSALKL